MTDPAVLAAVAHPTALRSRPAALEQLVFVADKLADDPTTPNVGCHARLREARDRAGLAELSGHYLDWAVSEGPRLGWRRHPDLIATEADLRPTPARP